MSEPNKVDEDFSASLSAAVDQAIEAEKKPEPEEIVVDNSTDTGSNESNDLPSSDGAKQVDLSPAPEKDKGDGDDISAEPEPISDDLLERAVKAGMSMRQARKFPDHEALEEAITLISNSGKVNGDDAEGTAKPKEEAQAPESDIDKLLNDINIDPKEYDSDLTRSVNALKDVVRTLHKQNQELMNQGSAKGFDAHLSSLDEAVAKAVRESPDKLASLRKKFDVLKAGYKAAGDTVQDSDVFGEAAKMVLADDISKAKSSSKSSQAQKRSQQLISRPSGKSIQPAKSADDEAARLLKEKFNLS
jgi:hypothetical protein